MLFRANIDSSKSVVTPMVGAVFILLFITLFFITENPVYLLLVSIPVLAISILFDHKVLFSLMILFLPFTFEFRIEEINLNIGMPSELLIGLLTPIALILILVKNKTKDVFNHPMVKIVLVYWLLLFISFLTSTMPEVSIKSFVVVSCYLIVFYLLVIYYSINNNYKITHYFLLYAISLLLVVFYATYHHYDYAFNKIYSPKVVEPFYSDHTIYGACLAFMVPIVGVFYFKSQELKISYLIKLISGICLIFFLIGVFLSHSRATWVSMSVIVGMLIVLKLKINFRSIMILLGVLLIVALFNLELLMPALVKNKYDSKAKRANLEEQIRSVTNIKNDVSNAERVNRWLCAVRMFEERPLTGYGIGTYQFKYIPFQKGSEMTEISITSAKNNYGQGMGGTAHSEYLLLLSESGIFAGIILLIIVLYSIYIGMKLYYHATGEIKYYALMLLLGLLTYFVHGIFNNFLTTEKAAFLVWTSLAVLTVLDIRYKK